MAFWSGNKLVEDIPKRKIVDLIDKDQVDCSAYTLTLGHEYFVTPDFEVDQRTNVKKQLQAPEICEIDGKKRKARGGTLVIPAGQFAYLLTEEIITIPRNVMGFISLKSGVKWRGLINVSGFHVDPGFKGRLVYSVYNAGPSAIHLNRGQDLFLLWLADLDKKASSEFARKNEPLQLEISPDKISDVDRQIHSLKQMSEKIETLDQQISNIKKVGVVIIALVSLFFGALKLIPATNEDSNGSKYSGQSSLGDPGAKNVTETVDSEKGKGKGVAVPVKP